MRLWRRIGATAREVLWNALLDARGDGAARSDDEIATEDLDGEVVAQISRDDWYRMLVWCPSLMVAVLEAAEVNGAQGVKERLAERAALVGSGGPPG